MAKQMGMSQHRVQQIWKNNDLKPHLVRSFKISRDPEKKFWDVIAPYLNAPDKALVLCCEEKSQCQALQRSQPALPLGIGHIRTKTHDYIRHGTISLFATLNYLDGKIISRTEKNHSHVEWVKFLKQIDRQTPRQLDLHLIVDNYSTHNKDRVKQWLERHPRFHIHSTPTSSSWMSLVERFFADLTNDVVRDGSFTSVRHLVRDIEISLSERNLNPKRYQWKAEGEEILRKIQKAKTVVGLS